ERSSNTFSSDTGVLWLPFQTAAGTVTTLYKGSNIEQPVLKIQISVICIPSESCDGIKRTSDAAMQCGYQRRTRELADWARSKKRRMIRRDDLLAYLAGKPLPPSNQSNSHRRSPKPEHNQSGSGGSGLGFQGPGLGLSSGAPIAGISGGQPNFLSVSTGAVGQASGGSSPGGGIGDDLHTFKEALVLRPRGPELFAFVANEISRHCKRPGSPIDDKMDICHYSSKRQRFM
ncbi:hypothetical protein KR018_000778, partial [Drosophila ironensis]